MPLNRRIRWSDIPKRLCGWQELSNKWFKQSLSDLMSATPAKAKPLSGTEIDEHRDNLLAPLSTAPVSARKLPYFHSCSGKAFRSILASGKIEKRKCNVFDEELVYFFYGKPAYRMPDLEANTRDSSRFPVCFVVTDLEDSEIRRVFPFDTGAMAYGIYADVCGPAVNPMNFEIGTDKNAISLFLGYLYASEKDYFLAQPQKAMKDIGALSFELQQIMSFILHYGASKWDSRAHTVEVQQDEEVNILSAPIEAIILPDSFLNDPRVADFLYNHDIIAIDYSVHKSNPSNATEVLFDNAKKYLEDKGVLR